MDLSLLYIDPIRMVFVNVVVSALLVILYFFYKYIYPKKNISPAIVCFVLAFLPLISIFRNGAYESGDMTIHAVRTMSFYKSLSENNIIPRWAADLNATYGYPLFTFIYPLPYYITSLFHHIGFNFINSVKMLLVSTYLMSGLFMYFWIKEHLSKNASLIAAVLYLYAPYHLVNMHFRASIGELTAIMFFPLSLLLIKRYIDRSTSLSLFLASMSLAFLVLSHQIVSLVGIPLILSYALLLNKPKNIKALLMTMSPFIFGLLLSSYYWIPALHLRQYTHQSLYSQSVNYSPISNFLYSTWRGGLLFQGSEGKFITIVGYIQILTVIYSIYLLVTKKIKTKLRVILTFNLIVFFLFLFITQNISKAIYNLIPLLKNMQFTYRLMNIIIIPASIIPGIVYEQYKHTKLFFLLILLATFPTILNWGNRGMNTQITDSYLQSYLPHSTAKEEGLKPAAPIWINPKNPWQKEVPEKHLEVIEGEADIQEIFRNSIKHVYKVNAKTPAILKENTYYFTGWKLYLNGKENTFIIDDINYTGIILIELDSGSYNLLLSFQPTSVQRLSFILSSITLTTIGISLLLTPLKNSSIT